MDAFVESARKLVAETADTFRDAAEGLERADLNRRPAGEDTNLIAVLATHGMSATRLWITIAVDADRPDRDRAAEFEAEAQDAASLIDLIGRLESDTLAVLEAAGAVDWSTMRTFTRNDGSSLEVSAAFALVHAIAHLEGHAAEASLTRHVIDRD